jgi:hypothetical protein
MKTANRQCKITGLTCGEIHLKLGGTGEVSLKAVHVLQDNDGNIHGRSEFVGPWPATVTTAISDLKQVIEAHLLTIHFEVNNDTTTGAAAPGEDSKPTGLFGTGLDDTEAETDSF